MALTMETPYTLARETGHLKCDPQDQSECQVPPEWSQDPEAQRRTSPYSAQMMPSSLSRAVASSWLRNDLTPLRGAQPHSFTHMSASVAVPFQV